MPEADPLVILCVRLALLSLVAVGGLHPILPDLHRLTVLDTAWLTEQDFTHLYALAQAAPGPNAVFITLVGRELGGIPGGLAATAAFVLPSVVLAYLVARVWIRYGRLRWFDILQRGLLPVTAGLMLASGLVVTDAAARGWAGWVLAGAVALVTLRARLHPFWLLALGGALGYAGVV